MKRQYRITAGILVLALAAASLADTTGDLDALRPADAARAKECGPVCAYFACKYYHIPATLDELTELCHTTEEGTTLANIRRALLEKGLFAEGLRLTPEMLLANKEYFLILPVREWGGGIDHFDVVMGSKGDGVLLLNYPSEPWFFPLQRLVRYWDGHALAISDRPVDVGEFQVPSDAKMGRASVPLSLALTVLVILLFGVNASNIWKLCDSGDQAAMSSHNDSVPADD